MKKQITIIVETEEDDSKMMYYIKKWMEDNFKKHKKAIIKIENIQENKKGGENGRGQ